MSEYCYVCVSEVCKDCRAVYDREYDILVHVLPCAKHRLVDRLIDFVKATLAGNVPYCEHEAEGLAILEELKNED